MKKFLFLFCLIAFASCKTIPVNVTQGETQITFDGHNLCADKEFSASINQDSIIKIFTDGFTVGSKSINMAVKYTPGLNNSPGDLLINLHACILVNKGQNICIDEPIHAIIPSGMLFSFLLEGKFIAGGMASIQIKYAKGILTIHPLACYQIVK